MKRLLTTGALFLCSLLTFAQGSLSGTGEGTEDNPYKIFNVDQLSQVANFLNQVGVVFKLMNDLDLTNWIAENNPSQGWLPIGVESSPFKGTFYGNGKKITGLRINRTSTNNVGFFGYVANATISDLTIEGTSITGTNNVGTLLGYVSGSNVNNCHVKMEGGNGITANSNVGGFAGYSSNTNYQNFSVTAIVTSSNNHGGFAGKVETGTLSDGSFFGELIGTGSNTGGLIGNANGVTLTNINVDATITGQDFTGGIVGCNVLGRFTNCKNEGNITGTQYVGGIVGALENTTSSFTSCFSKGKITATGDYAGGIVGVSHGACIEEMESCSHFGEIKGNNCVGGLIGGFDSFDTKPTLHTYMIKGTGSSPHTPSHSQTIIESIDNESNVSVPINNCVAIGNIEGSQKVGGLIGQDLSSYGYIAKRNNVTSSLGDYYKKLFIDGEYAGSSTSGYDNQISFSYNSYTRNHISHSLTNNYYSGIIYGTKYVGGLVGQKGGGELKQNYSYANIYGDQYVGGIVGATITQEVDNIFFSITMKSNVSICPIISATSSNLGRIYGFVDNMDYTVIGSLGSSESNRALTQTKVVLQGVVQEVEDDLQNGTSAGPTTLRYKANYVSWGWNFDENWNILETECYPYKKYQAAPPVIESKLVSQAMGISGKSLDGGTVYFYYKDRDPVSTVCNGNNWTFATEPLQSGAQVQIYADVESLTPSYFTTTTVGFPGSGTEEDPYRIYTAEDLQGASNRGYYKLMNDIDLTQWINENSPTEGWPAIGRNSGEATYIDGAGHKVTGLWMNTTQNYNGLFSNFSTGQIKNLTVEVVAGKKVKGGDYTGILIGRNANGRLVNCTVKGEVEGSGHVGGLVGYAENTIISSITADATIKGTSYVGGVAGQAMNCTISTCNAATAITSSSANSKVGGLVGHTKGGSISRCTAQNNLTAADASNFVGGLVGYSETPISLSFSTGSIAATGSGSYSGGLVGYANSPIENCYSTANTTGTLHTAGLVGYTFSTIDKCYAKGDVFGEFNGGGVVGYLDGSRASLTNSIACCNILSLTSQSSWGCRVIGGYKNGANDPDNSNYALSTMQVSLNNVPQNKTDNIVEGRAMTQEVLMQKNTYEQLGWDFSHIWDITEGEGYPVLRESNNTGGDEEPGPGEDPTPVFTNDDNLVVPQITAHTGETTIMYINLENKTTDLTAYQFDLVLPTGITVAKNNKGKFIVTKTNRYEDEAQSLQVSLIEGTNTYRFVSFSLSNDVISETKGAILNVTLAIDANVVEGNFEGNINDIVFTKSEGTQLKLNNVSFNIVVSDMVKGDTNGDGDINVSDIVEIVNCIMGKPSSKFVAAAADMNGDGEVNVTDIVQVVSIIMAGIGATARSDVDMAATTDNDRLTLTDGLSLRLENDGNYVAAQFDVRVSDGQTLDDISLNAERSGRHLLTYAKTGENLYKVVLYSLDNSSFSGHDGELLSIRVSGNGDVTLENIVFVTAGNAEKRFAPLGGSTTGLKAIDNLQFTIDNCYDLQGRRVTATKKGIYVVNGKKHVVR